MAVTFAFLHHLAAFTLVAMLVVELMLTRDELTLANARKILRADMIYGISAVALLIVGLGRVFHFEKGAFYYFHTWTFIAKLTLFVLVGFLSAIPTLAFLSWRGAVREGQVPQVTAERMRRVRSIIHLELVGIFFILLFAAMMAKGVGVF